MDLIERGNLVSPEVRVPFMIRGLQTLYGKKYLPQLLKSFNVRRIEDFFQEEKFRLLSDFYHDIRAHILCDIEYRESIGKNVNNIKLFWMKK